MRKTIFTLGLMLAAALSLTNCTKNEEATFTPEVKVPFELYANMDDTRTTNDGMSTKWAAGDAINVFHAVATSDDYRSDGSFSTADASGLFKGTLSETLNAGSSYDWYAFYPYSSYVKTPASTSSGYMPIGCKSNEYQTQNGNDSKAHIAGKNYPLYGVAKGVAASAKPSIKMSHASSLVEFVVKNGTGEAFVVKSIAFTAPEDIVGTYYINFASEPVAYTKSGDSYVANKAVLTVDGGTDVPADGAYFYMGIKPFTAAANSELTVNIETDKGTFAKTITLAKETTFSAGLIKTLTVTVNELVVPDEPESNLISTIDNLTAGQYYMAAYLVSYSNQGTNYDWTATPYHLWNGTVSSGDLVTVHYSFNDNVLETSSSDSAAVVTLEAVADKDNTYYVKCGGKYLTCTGKRAAQLVDTAVEWEFSAHTKGGICITDTENNVILGTAGAASNQLRCYVSPASSLAYGVVFFAVEGGGDVEPTPSITAENISNVAAEGVTDATVTFTSENLTEDITVTCDGIIVTAASVSGNVLTYTVAVNSGEAREGWIKLAANGVVVTITVSQLAPTSGETPTPGAGGGTDDFATINVNKSYGTYKTTAGWNCVNCCVLRGGTSNSNPNFTMFGEASTHAICMNGKTSAVGKITSPILKDGCGTLEFNYGIPYTDNKIKFKVEIKQKGAVVKSFTVNKGSATKSDVYSHEETVNVAGDFQIVFTNLCPSNNGSNNKDRTAIWNVKWTGYKN